jgi:hypothetical protein
LSGYKESQPADVEKDYEEVASDSIDEEGVEEGEY